MNFAGSCPSARQRERVHVQIRTAIWGVRADLATVLAVEDLPGVHHRLTGAVAVCIELVYIATHTNKRLQRNTAAPSPGSPKGLTTSVPEHLVLVFLTMWITVHADALPSATWDTRTTSKQV